MGLLDLPSPALSWLDDRLEGVLPPAAKLVLWAGVGALLSMELYRLSSPQRRVHALRLLLERARRRAMAFEGEVAEAWPLLRRMLSLALRRVGVVVPATLLASLPLLAFIVWLEGAYGGVFPDDAAAVAVTAHGEYEGRWIADPPRAELRDRAGEAVLEVPVAAPIPVIHKRRWWNALIGNPAGYLPGDAPVDRIEMTLPRRQVHALGPDWLRGWEAVFFPALVVFALAFKTARRIA